MNMELYQKMVQVMKQLEKRDSDLRNYFETVKYTASLEEKLAIKAEVEKVDAKYYQVKGDIKAYREAYEAALADRRQINYFRNFQDILGNRYGVEIGPVVKSEPVEVVETRKPKRRVLGTIATLAAAALLFTGAYIKGKRDGEKYYASTDRNIAAEEVMNTPIPTSQPIVVETEDGVKEVVEEAPVVEEVKPEETSEVEAAIEEVVGELPFEEYGNFTDVNDEAQLERRANWYYETYVSQKPSKAGEILLTPDRIMNDMRMFNGEFRLDSGNIDYVETYIIESGIDLHTIANYDSFKQYGNQIYFTPFAPLFEDGSLAQKGAIALDKAMEKVVAAIRADDKEAFVQAAREWGIVVVEMFDHYDFTGEFVNIHQVEAPTGFYLYHAMRAKYASTILEYSEKNHLNICIPYCEDWCDLILEDGSLPEEVELQEVALSEILYNLDERAIDAVAVRSGHLAEYEENNLSLPEHLYVFAKDYFNSKYSLEKGCSLTLNK